MKEKLSDRSLGAVIKAIEEFSDCVNARIFEGHLRKMVFAFLQADTEAAQYDYSNELWGELDALFSLLSELRDFQVARGKMSAG